MAAAEGIGIDVGVEEVGGAATAGPIPIPAPAPAPAPTPVVAVTAARTARVDGELTEGEVGVETVVGTGTAEDGEMGGSCTDSEVAGTVVITEAAGEAVTEAAVAVAGGVADLERGGEVG